MSKKIFNQELLKKNISFLLENTSHTMNDMDVKGVISKGYISNYLKDDSRLLSTEFIHKISNYFDYDINTMLNIDLSKNSKFSKKKTIKENNLLDESKVEYDLGLKPLDKMSIPEMKIYYRRILEDFETLVNVLKQFTKKDDNLHPIKELNNENMVKVPIVNDNYIKKSENLIEKINNEINTFEEEKYVQP